jgi:hypothetical protein
VGGGRSWSAPAIASRARRRWWRRQRLGQTFNANNGCLEVRYRAIVHLDAIDDMVAASQIKRVGAITPEDLANLNIIC